jgi:hypothetical protein
MSTMQHIWETTPPIPALSVSRDIFLTDDEPVSRDIFFADDEDDQYQDILSTLDMVEQVIDRDQLEPTPINLASIEFVQQVHPPPADMFNEDLARLLYPLTKKRKYYCDEMVVFKECNQHFTPPTVLSAYEGAYEERQFKAPRRISSSSEVLEGALSIMKSDEATARALRLRSYQNDSWSENFRELVKYREARGDCLVPHNWDTSRRLAQWVKRQRYQFKLKSEGRHSNLTRERQAALENLGFVWDSHAAVWEERLRELLEFRQVHGHCNVPSTFPENPQLSVWVKCQRRQYKLFRTGKRASMTTADRMTRLTNLGFSWNPRNL